jgi:hypothetical protein
MGRPPLNLLLCTGEDHKRADVNLVNKALEKWIPDLKLSKLKGPVVIGYVSANATTIKDCPPVSRSSAPTGAAPEFAYDTRTGNKLPLTPYDSVLKPSSESAFFVMQLLNIGGETVLTFYDSGANTHLVEGELAEKIGFTVLSDMCTQIGVVGGGSVWTDYGQYACVLGPDTNGVCHEIECQGLSRLTAYVPEFDLLPLHKDVRLSGAIPRTTPLPHRVGGDRVRLLIGIKSIAIAPTLRFSLPNGLGVFVSALPDIFG